MDMFGLRHVDVRCSRTARRNPEGRGTGDEYLRHTDVRRSRTARRKPPRMRPSSLVFSSNSANVFRPCSLPSNQVFEVYNPNITLPMNELQAHLGHSSITTTAEYYTEVEESAADRLRACSRLHVRVAAP